VKSETTTVSFDNTPSGRTSRPALVPALAIAWSQEQPRRAGEVVFFDDGRRTILGRGGADVDGRVRFVRQRPGREEPTPGIEGRGISREQLAITSREGRLHIERLGRCALYVNGQLTDRAELAPGDTVLLKSQLLLVCVRRPRRLPPLRDFPSELMGEFGEPDKLGLLGESPAAWELRERLAFAARSGQHLLLVGESGTGKELAAQAAHKLSPRSERAFVAHNAANLPSGIIDAELFGNARNYPNPGMAERPGIVGQADGGTLFLDEIGELPAELQAHLLRVLDQGEYRRLGEASARRADLRVVAATNRDPTALKHDFRARLKLTLELPGLDERLEDVPLLARYLVRRAARGGDAQTQRFLDATGEPRLHSKLVDHLLRHGYATHVRELDQILWTSMSGSREHLLELPDELSRRELSVEPAPAARPEPGLEELHAQLAAHQGNVTRAARALGLSRFALYRLMKKHGLG
jgi:two-component system nitrogen regulation response regulator GlnG/two-component system response regulator HydG